MAVSATGIAENVGLMGSSPFDGAALQVPHDSMTEVIQARRYQSTKMRRTWVQVSILGDFIVALLASMVAFGIRFHTAIRNVGPEAGPEVLRQYGSYFVVGSIWFVGILAWLGVYHHSLLLQRRAVRRKIVKGCLIWTVTFLAVMFAFRLQPTVSRLYTLIDGVTSLLFLVVWRAVLHRILLSPAHIGLLRQRTLLVGWNDASRRLFRSFGAEGGAAYEIVGCVSAGTSGAQDCDSEVPHLGSIEDIEDIISRQSVDIVVLTEIGSSNEETFRLASICERELVQFKIVPSCFRIFVSGLHVEGMAGTPMIGVDRLPIDGVFNLVLKRMVDVVGATIGLVLSAPLIAFFGALVWYESRGPIFYRQRRCGLNGKTFDIIKIRSMRLDAEKGGAQWSSGKADPRCLRIGALMRKWSVDELPQFWNVLKGDMSLVGPRPERPELIRNFKHRIPHYNARHMGKPGVTGWAQIHDSRKQEDLVERIRCDIWYLENWNLLLDLEILFLTLARFGKQ